MPVEQAWGVLLDVERIAPCMPGATLTGFDGTGFTGKVKVKLGPVSHWPTRATVASPSGTRQARRVVFVASGSGQPRCRRRVGPGDRRAARRQGGQRDSGARSSPTSTSPAGRLSSDVA